MAGFRAVSRAVWFHAAAAEQQQLGVSATFQTFHGSINDTAETFSEETHQDGGFQTDYLKRPKKSKMSRAKPPRPFPPQHLQPKQCLNTDTLRWKTKKTKQEKRHAERLLEWRKPGGKELK